ncbi:GNAT family N-acetyltransferase [Candidatus Enterococcus ferrettii]|uniref:Phosphinothricin acetyltransferase n=1 Tax=Candidatus Enterococcus ferrettii TaxID=2815324 RepID=A0ABV0ESZ7_9ENTE|nr:GNAT family N-acetyltransferase [Enterococcus sp. 665A]MBO1341481.1 N-acetyltransferase [Enterococcus sp. 665A]
MDIRLANAADAPALLAIYAPYVTDTAITFEYEVPSVKEFTQRITSTLKDYPYLVAENDQGEILGYAYAHAYKERDAYNWSVEVTVYLSEKAKGQGIGKQLYQALETELSKQNILILTACITGGNTHSIQFHEKLGYQQVGVFKKIGYKFERWHDVYWLQKTIGQPAIPMKKMIPYRKTNI